MSRIIIFLAVYLVLSVPTARALVLYVSADAGSDRFAGTLAVANVAGDNGPLASIGRAMELVEKARTNDETSITVWLRGGIHPLSSTLIITPAHSNSKTQLTFAAYDKGTTTVLSGGELARDWEMQPNGWWKTRLPQSDGGQWNFNQIYLNGAPRNRTRLPETGYYTIAGQLEPTKASAGKGYDQFQFKPGDIKADWHRLRDVEVLAFQVWTMARFRIKEVASNTVRFTGHTRGIEEYTALKEGRRYLVENVKEALGQPGRWYFDGADGTLTYAPLPGEHMESAVVSIPRIERLLELRGDVATSKPVCNVRFEGITFAEANFNIPVTGYTSIQSEVSLGAAIEAVAAQNCEFRNCRVERCGGWGIWWRKESSGNIVDSCELTELGAGAVRIGETDEVFPKAPVHDNVVSNTLMWRLGRIHPAGVGVLIGHAYNNRVLHNTIADLYYTGISVGWSWGYGDSVARGNIISGNHIRDVGQGVLSDMGGIYTLGISPGTVLDGNFIEDVRSFDYGGWGIYTDEGSTSITIHNNIVTGALLGGFHQHYGRENLVENNIFAFNGPEQIKRTRAEEHHSFTFTRNIVVSESGSVIGSKWDSGPADFNHNLYFNTKGDPVFAGSDFAAWQKLGKDKDSIIADPQFVDAANHNFAMKGGSPAEKIGFKSIDQKTAGRTGGLPVNFHPQLAWPSLQ